MKIDIRHVNKQFGEFLALQDINLTIEQGEFVALLGPSGSGKTTLLRTIAGLEGVDAGNILFSGEDMTAQQAKDRGVGFIFQHYALFRHMTVFDNVAFGLTVKPKSQRLGSQEINEKVMTLLKMVQLDWLKDRFPAQLSGGQKQRVALARALAVEPKLLLLDEPFGALDTTIRKELRIWLRGLHDRLNMTSIFVTHDIDEALEVADKIVVLNAGKIVQIGTPEEIYHQPANAFVYKFIGDVHHFEGVKSGGQVVDAFVRSNEIKITLQPTGRDNQSEVTIQYIKHMGHSVRIEVENDSGLRFDVRLSSWDPILPELSLGKRVFVTLDASKMFIQDYTI